MTMVGGGVCWGWRPCGGVPVGALYYDRAEAKDEKDACKNGDDDDDITKSLLIGLRRRRRRAERRTVVRMGRTQ